MSAAFLQSYGPNQRLEEERQVEMGMSQQSKWPLGLPLLYGVEDQQIIVMDDPCPGSGHHTLLGRICAGEMNPGYC